VLHVVTSSLPTQAIAAGFCVLLLAEGSLVVPKQLLLVDLHEVDDLERTLNASGRWNNRRRVYDSVHGRGTYFASALDYFLAEVFLPSLDDISCSFVIFPDYGAHRRFYSMVHEQVVGISLTNILFISKSRVGTEITQEERLSFVSETGGVVDRAQNLPAGSRVLIVDDFTNSGSTLFGGANIVRKRCQGQVHVSAFVSHYVAKYDRQAVSKFVSNLYDGHALDRYVRATSFAFSALSVQTIGSPRCVPTISQTKGCGAKSVCVFCAGFIAQIPSPKSWIGCWRNVGSGRTSLSECRHDVPHKFPQMDNVRD